MKFSDVPVARSDYSAYSDRSVFVDFEVVFGVVLGLVILEIKKMNKKYILNIVRLTWWMSHLRWDPMMGISGRIMR